MSAATLRALSCVALSLSGLSALRPAEAQQQRHYLYVGVPGSDNDIGDHRTPGILVFDIDKGHTLIKRIAPWRPVPDGEGAQVRGLAADVRTRRLYLSTTERVAAIDLLTERVIWEKSYGGFCCDRLDVSPDGRRIYAPAFGKPRWHAINALDGALIATVDVMGWPRQTIYARDGRHAYLGAWESDVLSVVDTAAHKIIRTIGPFGDSVCPFTLNGLETLAFANVDGLVGFEVGDLGTGLVLDRVIVDGVDAGGAAKYECPSHGIALTPDERELWLADGVENRLHIFDATTYPPAPTRTIDLRAQPRWITFGIDGRYAYVSTGDVIDVSTKKIVSVLEDERGTPVRSEKMLEIDFAAGQPVAAGRQAGIGRRR